jgi:hypothetical protein
MLAENDEACASWTERLEITTLTVPELAQVLGWLSLRNLRTIFASEVNLQSTATELLQLVSGNWYHITRLGDILDEELGPERSGEKRAITREVLTRVKQRFQS